MITGRERNGSGVALFRPSETKLEAGPIGEGLPVRVVEVRGRAASPGKSNAKPLGASG